MGKFKVQDKFLHKSPFFEHNLSSIFLSNQTWAFYLYFDSIPVFNPDFFMRQKFSDKYAKSGISLKYAVSNFALNFLICIMVLINEEYSTKNRHKWIQYLLNFKLFKLNFNWVFRILIYLDFLTRLLPNHIVAPYTSLNLFNSK